jgi:hypothetical protein
VEFVTQGVCVGQLLTPQSFDKDYGFLCVSTCNLQWVCIWYVALGGIVVSVLTTGPKVRGFNRGRWIFKGDKNPEHHFLRRGSKAVGPMS